MKQIYYSLLASLMLLAGCSKENTETPGRTQPPAGMGEVTLGEIRVGDASASLSPEASAATRATTSSNLPAGATLRLYAFEKGETNFTTKLATRTYTIDASGAARIDAGQDPLYLPIGEADIYLVGPVAYNSGTQAAPVMEEVATEFSVNPHIGVDLIAAYATATIAAGTTNPLPAIMLEHKMAQAQIVVEAHPAAAYENLVVKEIKLYGQPTAGTFTLDQTGGVITPGQQVEDFVYPSVAKDPSADKYSATTVLIPQAERELKVETTFECNQQNVDAGDNHPTLKYRQSGLITAPLAAGTATRFSTAPITPVEIKWRTKVLPWNEVQGEDFVIPGPDRYVEINGLRWATGNLVANGANGAKIGEPTDYGLYFHFGSLVGWSGGSNGDGTGQGQPLMSQRVKPLGYRGSSSWPAENYNFGSPSTGYCLPSTDVAWTGIGDPCRYYLGGTWRTPTAAEYKTLFDNVTGGVWGSAPNWSWVTSPYTGAQRTGNTLFFPASGNRGFSGPFERMNERGFSWSSSIDATTYGFNLALRSDNIATQGISTREYGYPVRCVSTAP